MIPFNSMIIVTALTGSMTVGGIIYKVNENDVHINALKSDVKDDIMYLREDIKEIKRGNDVIISYLIKGKSNE